MDKPEYVYMGRAKCGCIRAVMVDTGDKHTANRVREMIMDGLTIERVTFGSFEHEGGVASVFADCPHKEKQLAMFKD